MIEVETEYKEPKKKIKGAMMKKQEQNKMP